MESFILGETNSIGHHSVNTEYGPLVAYPKFLLANSSQELTQMIKDYLKMGQYETSRAVIIQLLDLDHNQANQLLLNIIQSPMRISTTPSIPSSAHLTWLLVTEYHSLNHSGKIIARELLQSTEFEIILQDLVDCDCLSAKGRQELSELYKKPTQPTFSESLRSELDSAFSNYPILAHTLCQLISSESALKSDGELSRVIWSLLVDLIGRNLASESTFDSGIKFLQYLTFTSSTEPSNVSNMFESIIRLYFPPVTDDPTYGNSLKQNVYSQLLSLPPDSNYALQLFASIEENIMKRECEKLSSSLAWPFEMLRSQNANFESKNALLDEFWNQYFNFLLVSKNHIFEYIVSQFFDLIHERRFEDCKILLAPFSRLKPLLLLLSFEKFGDDINFQQNLIDILWNDQVKRETATKQRSFLKQNQITNSDLNQTSNLKQDNLDDHEVHLNIGITDKANSLAYQVKLARWISRQLISQIPPQTDPILNSTNSEQISLMLGSQQFTSARISTDELEIQLSNSVSGLLRHHGILWVLSNYLHNIPLVDVEQVIMEEPVSQSKNDQKSSVDLLLIYCYYALKNIVELVNRSYLNQHQSPSIPFDLGFSKYSMQEVSSIIHKIQSFPARLALLQIIYNFIFMKSSAWASSEVSSLSSFTPVSTTKDSFVVGAELALVLVTTIKSSLSSFKSQASSSLQQSISEFETKLKETEWRITLIKTRPYFTSSSNSFESLNDFNSMNNQINVAFVNVLIAKPESLLVRAIRERDFEAAHAIIDFFKLKSPEDHHINGAENDTQNPNLSTDASHLAKLSEMVYRLRKDLNEGKSLNTLISSIQNSLQSSSSSSTQNSLQTSSSTQSSSSNLSSSSQSSVDTTLSKIEFFFLLADLSLTANLTIEQSNSLLDSAQQVLRDIQPLISESKFSHFCDYLDRLKTFDRTFSKSEKKTQDLVSEWLPPTLNARLTAMENWPTESDALAGFLLLKSRLQTAYSRLRSLIEQSKQSEELGVMSVSGLDSDEIIRNLTTYMDYEDVLNYERSVSPRTPTKSNPIITPIATPSKSSQFMTPKSQSHSIIPQSPSTVAKLAFSNMGEGFLQSFLRQLLMIGSTLRDDSHVGRADYFQLLKFAPKHILAELVYGSRNYTKADYIATELEVELVPLLLELMGTCRPSSGSNCGSKTDMLNKSKNTQHSDLALDYMPNNMAYNSNLNYEYGITPNNQKRDHVEASTYSLNMKLVEYLKSHSPLVATLACILRAPSDKFDERFLDYALSSSKRHFPPLHLWLRVKIRQFAVFYNAILKNNPEEVDFPIGTDFVSDSSRKAQINNLNSTSQQANSIQDIQSSFKSNSLKKSMNTETSESVGVDKFSNMAKYQNISGSFVPTSLTSSFSSVNSVGFGLGGVASPTSSMTSIGIGLQNNPVLKARAESRNKNDPKSTSDGQFTIKSQKFNQEEDDDDDEMDLSQVPGSYSPRSYQASLSTSINDSRPSIPLQIPSHQSPMNRIQIGSLSASLPPSLPPSLPGSALTSPRNQSALKTQFPSIDSLDAKETAIFEQIFQNESFASEVETYTLAIQELAKNGHYLKALHLADAALPHGAPDWLLKALVDSTADKTLVAAYILRMNDKVEASKIALQMVPKWEIPIILQVLFMCECHLSREQAVDPSAAGVKSMLQQVQEMHERFQRYAEIMDVMKDEVSTRWNTWLELDELARKDLAIVVQLLLNGGHYDIARNLADHFKHTFLKMRVEEKYLLHLLEMGDTRGVRMRLRSLEGEEAVRIAQSLMDLVATNNDRLFLTQFIMERKSQQAAQVSQPAGEGDLSNLTATELGLKILLCLPPELQKVFQPLMSRPSVIIESLLVSEQTLVLNRIFKEIPQVHNDELVMKYARKALDGSRLFSVVDNILSGSLSSHPASAAGSKNSSRATTPRRLSIDEDELPPQTIGYAEPEPQLSSGNRNYTNAALHGNSNSFKEGKKKLYLADEKKEHTYSSAPNYPLAAGILDLCRNTNLVAQSCIEISDKLSARLHSIKDRLFVVRIIQQLLMYAKLRLMTNEDGSSDPGLVQTCDMLLQRTELLLQLIFCGGTATASAVVELSKSLSLSMLADSQKVRALRERLIENDMADLALMVANKCGVETEPIWAAKALRMLETNRYQEAKQLFRYCLVSAYNQEDNEEQQASRSSGGLGLNPTKTVADNTTLLTKIISILEKNVAVEQDKLASRSIEIASLVKPAPNSNSNHLKSSAMLLKRFKNMEDVDSSDSALKSLEALRKPSTQTGPSKRSHRTLDSIRYMQCIYYLQRFGSEDMFIKFWLRHGLLEDCLRHIDNKPPPIDTKVLLVVVNHALSHNLFPRFRDALYKIDKNLERWRDALLFLCVHFHQNKMPHLLLEIQLLMKDFTRAGLTSMSLMASANSNQEKLKYLAQLQQYFTYALERYDEDQALQQKDEETNASASDSEAAASSSSKTSRVPLSRAELSRHIKTAILHSKYIEFMETLVPTKTNTNPDSLPSDVTLFGSNSMRNSIAEILIVNHNFDLAFKIIQEYRLSADRIYRDAVVKMAKRKQHKKIDELIKTVKVLLRDRDLDACYLAAAKVYGTIHQDYSTAEAFATKIQDQSYACEAYIACRKLKQAYLIAVKLADLDLVRAIQQEAKRLDMKREYELCDTFLRTKEGQNQS